MDGYPAWFPDGKTIAFSSDRVHDGWLADFWLIDADGSNLRQVTDSPGVGDLSPSVSPDGKSIVFETFVPEEARQVVRVDVDGRNRRQLTDTKEGIGNMQPDWGPDGKTIAFASERDGNSEIYVMDADGRNQTRLTRKLAHDRDPVWSPDRKKIAFWSDRKGILQTWVMDADGRNQRNLSAKIGPDWGGWPTDWTHDGRILIATKGEV